MSDFVFYTGIVIVLAATAALFVFALRQNKIRERVKDIPWQYDEWKSHYRTKRWYLLLVQIAGWVIAMVGLYI